MAYNKIPELRYQLFGGLNTKVSQYLNTPMEFISLENLDFQQPGSLVERWGSTQFFGQSLSGKINGLFEFTQTTGASAFFAAAGGTLGSVSLNGFSVLYSGSTAGTSFFTRFGSSFIDGYSLKSFDLDFDVLQNNCFFANGADFLKATAGNSIVFFGLGRPRLCSNNTGVTQFISDSYFAAALGSSVAGGFTGYYYYKLAWINSYGFAGAPTVAMPGVMNTVAVTAGATGIGINVIGMTLGRSMVPPNTDISALGFFRAGPFGTTLSQALTDFTIEPNPYIPGVTGQVLTAFEAQNYFFVGSVGVSAGSAAATFIDANTSSGITLCNLNILPWDWYQFSSSGGAGGGLTFAVGTGVSYIPKFIETHDNRLFVAGVSYAPSTFFFSEEFEPEHFEADFGFQVKTQDGTPITALKEYNGNLMVFKTNSFFLLNTSAVDPDNWTLTNISNEYGCLGNRAVCVHSNVLLFLDRKGIIEFNGSNITIKSTKIDPIFQRMNLSAASGAVMTYDKTRNEVLCEIPVDGSTTNNLTVVYDIVANAWTTYKGYRAAVTAIAQSSLSQKAMFYGGYSGLVSYFGPSFLTDNGTGFTVVAKSGFLVDLGESVQKVFRRLFLDTDPVGASSFIDVNLYQDYGSSKVFAATMMLNQFQSRIDFGVSSKSLAVEFICGSTIGLALHGFAVQYRFQRNV